MNRTLVAALLASAAIALGSCSVDQYCLNCETGDGGGSDAGSGSDGGTVDAHLDGGSGSGSCDPAMLGLPCGNQMGACAGGSNICTNGAIVCSKNPSAEVCDGIDNDCDGVIDNGDPGGGGKCGIGVGECTFGTNHCISGTVQCIGAGQPTTEICDGEDNDCDGKIDEGLSNMGSCGTSNVGVCKFGTLECIGGTSQCIGAVNPGFEVCNGLDDDCDGKVDEGFDTQTDPENCGSCGHVCMLPNAYAGCAGGQCTVAGCQPGFVDLDGNPANGCEYQCTVTGVEVCDGKDNDCDGKIDEDLGTPPAICQTQGACAGTVAQCEGSGGYVCNYPSTVSTGSNGQIVPETECDGIDNDCDGKVDEGQPNLNQPCNDGGIGVCEGTGKFECNTSDRNGPAVCVITSPGQAPSAEQCDNLDNDCDGKIDEGGSTGSLIGQNWVTIGNGKQMLEYEASRPDSNATSAGSVNTIACSKQGVQPWVDITYPEALAACQSIGATLCDEEDWHRTCSVVAPSTYPIALASSGTVTKLVEAEDFFKNTNATDTAGGTGAHAWIEDYLTDTNNRVYSGISDLTTVPVSGAAITNANATTQAPHLDYEFTVNQIVTTYTVWALLDSPSSNSNEIAVNFDGAAITTNNEQIKTTSNNVWQWVKAKQAFTFTATGTHTLNVYMLKDGVKIDAIEITNGTATPALPQASAGGNWSYATNPNTAQTGVCNDENFNAGNDNTIPTGTDTTCVAETGTGVADMSGNVKEWVLAHLPGQDPIRGGAANNDEDGTACPLNFTLADDSFFFPNVGFRCCRVGP